MKKIRSLVSVLLLLTTLLSCTTKSETSVETSVDSTTADMGSYTLTDDPNFQEGFSMEEIDFSKISTAGGRWSGSENRLTGSNSGSGDCFAMLDCSFDEQTAFIVEADVHIDSGVAAGFVFGVQNPQDPSSGWYCVNIDRDRPTTRLFSVNTGNVGTESSAQRYLTDEEKKSEDFHLCVEVYPGGTIVFSLNGEYVADFTDESYAGGSIGFMTYQSKVTYTNCRIRILENTKSLTAMKLTGATLKQTFSSEKTYYQASAAATAVSFRLSLEATEGTTIHVNGQKYAEGASYATLNLSYGENRYEIVTTTSDGKQDQTILLVNRALTAEEVYSDTYRPYFHYTSASGWENDPNGLIYNEKTGEYHLYYQYPPHDIGFNASAMTWGHAVSTDLVHWVQQGVAIDTDRLGCIWSGSCVVDEENSSGLFDDSTDPKERLVAIYTYYNQKQAIAYSPDGGYTWKKYEGNPVLSCDTYGYDFRDPKVQWIEDADQPNGGLWLMIVAGGRAQIYTSPDLIHWTFNSALTYLDGSPVYSECPDLYCLPVDGNPNNRKWVYVGGGSFYIIGDLKKVKGMYQFVATSQRNDCYNGGSDVYATTSFYNDPKGRRVSMSWIQDYSASSYEDKNWNGAMTVPYETTLRTVDGQIILCSYPVEELSTLYGETVWEGSDLSVGSSNVLPEITEKIYRMELSLDLGDSTSLTIRIRKSAKNRFLLRYDRQKQLLTLTTDVGSYSAPLKEQNGKIDLTLLVDASILEVFGNSGEAAICARYYPIESSSEQTTELTCSGGNAKILWGKVQKMKSSWLTIDN